MRAQSDISDTIATGRLQPRGADPENRAPLASPAHRTRQIESRLRTPTPDLTNRVPLTDPEPDKPSASLTDRAKPEPLEK